MKRTLRYAGAWYPASQDELKNMLISFIEKIPGASPFKREKQPDEKIMLSLIVPHAGLVYSGPIAAYSYYEAYNRIEPETIILVGPSHYGGGARVSVFAEGVWEGPFGDIKIDEHLAKQITYKNEIIAYEPVHIREHCLEMQLPFIQFFWPNTKIVPILMGDQSLYQARNLGKIISSVFKTGKHLLITTSDFSHYVSKNEAEETDYPVIEAILTGEEEEVYKQILEYGATPCGYGPMGTNLAFLNEKHKNATIKFLKYGTSGDITGDYSSVVAYAAIISYLTNNSYLSE